MNHYDVELESFSTLIYENIKDCFEILKKFSNTHRRHLRPIIIWNSFRASTNILHRYELKFASDGVMLKGKEGEGTRVDMNALRPWSVHIGIIHSWSIFHRTTHNICLRQTIYSFESPQNSNYNYNFRGLLLRLSLFTHPSAGDVFPSSKMMKTVFLQLRLRV